MTSHDNIPTNRLLTGDRPTGRLHLGHYVGSIEQRVSLQHQYESYFIIADLHMLTTKPEKSEIAEIGGRAKEMVLDALACGIDPDKATFYLQSGVPEVCVLQALLAPLVSVPRLERIPSLKEMAASAGRAEMPFALLGYPVLQAADVLSVRASIVPVGKDNHAHIELVHELARRFNNLYGPVFPEVRALLADTPSLVGTDGKQKMSKSLDNAIYLTDDDVQIRAKVKRMYTDPTRVRADIPADPAGNPVFLYHELFNDRPDEVDSLKRRYRRGAVGDVEVKQQLAEALIRFLGPIRERRQLFATQKGLVETLLVEGTARVRAETQQTLRLAEEAMGLNLALKRMRRRAERMGGPLR